MYLLILVLAAVLRLTGLGDRPMHTDEAVQGMKTGLLLETGEYRYDREEYHGPALPYLTIPVAWMAGERSLDDLDETTLRMVPALFGILSVLILLLLVRDLGWPLVLLAGLITALSPALSYYSRYYIHETLMAFFTLGFLTGLIRSFSSPHRGWMVVSGIFLGLMVSTKETWVIHLGTLAISGLVTWWILPAGHSFKVRARHFSWQHPALVAGPALLIPLLLYSSFLGNIKGIGDALLTFATYVRRAAGDPDHLHSFGFYLGKLAFARGPDGMIWSELWIMLAAMAGCLLVFLRRSWSDAAGGAMLLVAIFALLLALVYAVIPYKTPWILVNFYLVWMIPAASGLLSLSQDQAGAGKGRSHFFVRIPGSCLRVAGLENHRDLQH